MHWYLPVPGNSDAIFVQIPCYSGGFGRLVFICFALLKTATDTHKALPLLT
jgi:hypothetical protein